jgi:hypothetical protein
MNETAPARTDFKSQEELITVTVKSCRYATTIAESDPLLAAFVLKTREATRERHITKKKSARGGDDCE